MVKILKEYKRNEMTVILREDDIIEMFTNEDWKGSGTLENAKEIMSIVQELTEENKSRACLVEVPNRHAPKEVLGYYQTKEAGYSAQALLLNSFGAKVMGNLYLKLFKGKPNEAGRIIPTKLFTHKSEAVKWLLGEIEKTK